MLAWVQKSHLSCRRAARPTEVESSRAPRSWEPPVTFSASSAVSWKKPEPSIPRAPALELPTDPRSWQEPRPEVPSCASDDHGTASRSDLPWEQGTADLCRPGHRPQPGPVRSGGSGHSSRLRRSQRYRPCSWHSGAAGLSPRAGCGRGGPGWRVCAGWAVGSAGGCPHSSHAGTPEARAEQRGVVGDNISSFSTVPRAPLSLVCSRLSCISCFTQPNQRGISSLE